MIKKDYQKPTIKVAQLQQRQHLLQASDLETLSGHAKSGEETEDTWYDLE